MEAVQQLYSSMANAEVVARFAEHRALVRREMEALIADERRTNDRIHDAMSQRLAAMERQLAGLEKEFYSAALPIVPS
jgi:signal transduction histidine kinase